MRGITQLEGLAYHHVFEEAESDAVTLTWPRTIPLKKGDSGWQDMKHIQNRLPELAAVPVAILWGVEDMVFNVEYAHRLKELLPHAEGPVLFDHACHFLQDDRGPDIAREIISFLNRRMGAAL